MPQPKAHESAIKFDQETLQALSAVQAVMRGDADEHQQKRAIDWIITQAANTYDLHYRPDSERDTSFALGRAFVGQQIVNISKLDPAEFKRRMKEAKQ